MLGAELSVVRGDIDTGCARTDATPSRYFNARMAAGNRLSRLAAEAANLAEGSRGGKSKRPAMLDSTASLRELLLSYQQLLGIESATPDQPQRDARQQVRELAQDWLTQLLGMDIDIS